MKYVNDRVYCVYDTMFFLDGDHVVGFCEETDVEDGCGWMVRAINIAPKQSDGLSIFSFRQIDELNGLHQIASRTLEQLEETRARARRLREEHRSDQ